MNGIVLREPGAVGLVDDWPEPECGPQDVLVRMSGIGLCGSDLSLRDGTTRVPRLPWLLGHEGGGVVVDVGADVRDRHVGQTVVIEPNICCFECDPCRAGVTSSCRRRRILGLKEPGIASERVSVPSRFTWPVPEGIAPEALSCLEPYVVTRAAVRRAGIRRGDSCLVVGAGSQGLLLCQTLLELGAVPYVTEPHAGRAALAHRLGARPAEEGPRRHPFVFETSGAPAAFPGALDAVGPAGVMILIGQSRAPAELTTRDLVQRQITLRGSLIYDHPRDFEDAVRDIARDEDRLRQVVQARFSPAEAGEAFAAARSVPGKSWIDFSTW